jgi:hypothetical protein
MSMRYIAPVTDVTALPPAGSSGTITVRVPGNMRLHELVFNVQQGQTGALTTPAAATQVQIEAAIKEVRINQGARLLRVFSAAQLFTILKFNGYTVNDGIMPVLFSEPWRGTVMAEEITSWDLYNTRGLTIDVDVVVPAPGTFFAINISRKYDFLRNVDSQGNFIGRYILWKRISESFVSGENTRDNLPKELPYSRLHIFAASSPSKVTRAQVRLENTPVYDIFDTAARPEYKEHLAPYKFAAQAGHHAIVTDYDQQIQSVLPVTPSSLHQVVITTSAVDTPWLLFEQHTTSIL